LTVAHPKLLGILLNDHLAGSTGGVELARRATDQNAASEFGQPLAAIRDEIEVDRATLEAVMDDLGVARSRVRPALAWVGERFARLKPNGRVRGYSPLSRVIELEGLVLGITGKLRLWRLLTELVGDDSPADFGALAGRAEDQRTRAEALQGRAAALL
jgi:hypothetical protein